MFLDAQGNPVPDLSTRSALAAGIPGEPAGMALLAARYGRLPVAQSLQPAIRLARAGFPQSVHLHGALLSHLEQFAAEPAVARNFLRDGAVPPVGTLVRQPELAATLEHLARHGLESFYQGEMAARLVAGVRAQGGIWSEADLAAYRAIERAPIVGQYRGAEFGRHRTDRGTEPAGTVRSQERDTARAQAPRHRSHAPRASRSCAVPG